MLKKILIANRGEIACRVIRTARRLGIATVAVYSDADEHALHVKEADEAIRIGPAPSSQSYISIPAVMEAIRQSGADAVHPGYGFLSENASFARALENAGVAFIGPPLRAIEVMGDKISSKKVAAGAGVSVVPGHMGLIETPESAAKIAKQIGYPVMMKASAGGGGKGMRIAWSDGEAIEGFKSCRNEARSSFGDERIFIEKYITEPRHIEIQVLGDKHGEVIHLGERECSIQRRNQKVIEEAPSPFLDERLRQAMGAEAVALAKSVGYYSAGTVEFIVDGAKNFYFLEMNTRLQVEHPVTELITGLDLVEEMIRVAAGEPLRIGQDQVTLNGWAVESRLYAEDPYRNFLPSVGRLTRYRPPEEGWQDNGTILRTDTGVYEGGEIPVHYDPMIAKLCAWGPDRTSAIEGMSQALDRFELEGIGHNLPFLSAIMGQDRFREGRLTTAYIAEEFPDGFKGVEPDKADARMLAAVAALLAFRDEARSQAGSAPPPKERVVQIGEHWIELSARVVADFMLVDFGEGPVEVSSDWQPGRSLAAFHLGGKTAQVKTARAGSGWRLRWKGIDLIAHVRRPAVAELARQMPKKAPPDTSKLLLCPMPGVLVDLMVKPGEAVVEGQPLATVEAMKMENVLRAQQAGRVKRVAAGLGDSLTLDQLILEFE
jgi:propionyl-CoA carboxylase alpha chain